MSALYGVGFLVHRLIFRRYPNLGALIKGAEPFNTSAKLPMRIGVTLLYGVAIVATGSVSALAVIRGAWGIGLLVSGYSNVFDFILSDRTLARAPTLAPPPDPRRLGSCPYAPMAH